MRIERAKRWSPEELKRAQEIARAHLKSQPQPAPAPSAPPSTAPVFGPMFRAAAVSSRFRTEDLIREHGDAVEAARLADASLALRDRLGPGWRSLRADVRNAVLQQMDATGIAEQIRRAGGAGDDPMRKALTAALRGLRPQELITMPSGEVVCLVQVHEAVSGVLALPPRAELERKLELVRLLEPLKRITATFSGRAAELKKLRDFVGVVPPTTLLEKITRSVVSTFTPTRKAPYLICGLGGVGKTTLVSRFILEHALVGSDMQFPFAYLDFDRPTVMAENAGSVFLEAIRQIGLQYDSAHAASERLRQRGEQAMRAAATADESLDAFIAKNFADFLHTLEVREGPVLFVLDTFEEVQRRSSVYAASVIRMLQQLSQQVPRLRVVIAGRTGIPDTEFDQILTLEQFDEASAVAYLNGQGVAAATAAGIYATVGGSPLALSMAVDLFRRGKDFHVDRTELNDQVIQACLYDRILLHIPDDDVRRLAHPGLILRRITEDLIREVLAQPCQIDLSEPGKAAHLLEELAKESTLVTEVEPGVLLHRADVRRLMLHQLRRDVPRKVEEIHTRAVAYYALRNDLVARAEQVYHRLCLLQGREQVAALVGPELEPLLANAMEEFAPPEQALLADLLGMEMPQAARQHADQLSWERATSRMLKESMRSSAEPTRARAALAERTERSGATDLRLVELQFLDSTGRDEELERLAAEGIAAYRAAGERDLLVEMLLAAASIDIRDGRQGSAHTRLTDAERIAVRADDPLLLAKVFHGRAHLLRTDADHPEEDTQADLVRAVARVSDAEWARELPLLRSIAEEVGRSAPAILGRALRLGALELTASGLEYMRQLLREEGLPADDVKEGLLEVIYHRTPTPRLLDALISVTREEAARREQRALPRAQTPLVRLKPAQRDQLADIVGRHYAARLALLSESRFGVQLEAVTFSEDVSTTATDFVRATERDGRLGELLVKLARDRFDHPEVLAFLDSIGMGPKLRPTPSLPQKELSALVAQYRGTLGAIQARTCVVEHLGVQGGCGVLVGADEVLTLVGVSSQAVFRFDATRMNGKSLDVGRTCRAVARPPVAVLGPVVRLQLDSPLGDSPVDAGATDSTVAPRGFARTDPRPPAPGDVLLWLWREHDETWISGVRLGRIRHAPSGLVVLPAPSSAKAAGCACLDAGMNVVGILTDPLQGEPGASAMLAFAQTTEPAHVSSAPQADPFSVVVAGGRVFVNRHDLRSALKSMVAGGARILVVNGASGTGKSFTSVFVRHLAGSLQFRIAQINFSGYAADRAIEVADVATALAHQLGIHDLPPGGPSTAAAWSIHVSHFLADRIGQEAHTTWIVFDEFESTLISPSVQDFLLQLLQRTTQQQHLRCVLVGYEGQLPPDLDPYVVRETTRPIAFEDLKSCLVEIHAQHGIEPDHQRIDRDARQVFQHMQDAGPASLRVMARELAEISRKLIGANFA